MIRIIHTSDWHLGLELNEHNRLEEQAIFLDWLIVQCIEQNIDALLVSGDIYDVINPSIEAQALFARFIGCFKSKLPNSNLVIIGGNHDSGLRMEVSRPLVHALGNLHIVGSLNHKDSNFLSKHIISLNNREGVPSAWCLAVPFLRADDLDCKIRESETPIQAFNRSITELYKNLKQYAQDMNPHLPIIAMGHLTTVGSQKSGSERILIGGVESVNVESISEGMDYVALGHIHRGQPVSGNKVHYSGSPLSMDFDERRYQHKLLLVEIENSGATPVITPIQIPQLVEFIRFCEPVKTWDEVEIKITNYDWSKWKETSRNLHPFVDIQFTADGAVGNLRERTEELLKKFPIRLVSSPRRIAQNKASESEIPTRNIYTQIDLKSKDSPLSIFSDFYLKKYTQELPEELKECFIEILDETKIQGGAK